MAPIIAVYATLTILVVLTGHYLGWGGLFLLAIGLMFVLPWAGERFGLPYSYGVHRSRSSRDERDADPSDR